MQTVYLNTDNDPKEKDCRYVKSETILRYRYECQNPKAEVWSLHGLGAFKGPGQVKFTPKPLYFTV